MQREKEPHALQVHADLPTTHLHIQPPLLIERVAEQLDAIRDLKLFAGALVQAALGAEH